MSDFIHIPQESSYLEKHFCERIPLIRNQVDLTQVYQKHSQSPANPLLCIIAFSLPLKAMVELEQEKKLGCRC